MIEKPLQRLVKRTLDVAISAAGVVAFAPVVAVAATAVAVTMGRPAFFRQTRPGLHGEPFSIWKLRTMSDTRGVDGQLLPDAARLTRLGRVLRATSIDELPQLLNVLKGEMSIVGPRPLLMQYLPLYSSRQSRRHDVRPGITGWAQVHGRNATDWDQRLELDVWYVENWSLLLDARIVATTFRSVLMREGIARPGEATMSPFTGSGTGPGHDPIAHRPDVG